MRGEFVDLGGTRMYYYAAGTRGGGDPVVFLHGFPGSSHSWRLVAPLMPPGRRLVIVDLMGCGRSDGPPDGASGGAAFATHVSLVRRLLDDLAISRAAIVAHGMGAAIAQGLAIEHADRVSALCLASAPAFGVWPRRLARLARLVAPAAGVLGAQVLASFAHGSGIRGYADREAGRRSLDVSLRAYPARLGTHALLAQLHAVRDGALMTLGARLGEVAVPSAVIWGARDPFLPQELGARISAAIPGASFDVVPDARHFVNEDAPERFADIVSQLLARSG